MSTNNDDLPSVEPGQLITADFMNQVLQRLQQLDERVSSLEEGSPPDEPEPVEPTSVEITGHSPEGVRVGEQLTLSGKNFAVPGEVNDISIGGVSVPDGNVPLGSSETSLTFTVPSIDGLDQTGSNLTVEVANANGTAQRTVLVKPESVVPNGSIEVQYTEEPLTDVGQIVGGETYKFTFLVTAFASQPGDYQATVTTGAGWNTSIEGADGASMNFSLPSKPKEGASQEITVGVDVPDQGSGSTDLTLEVIETTPNTNVNMGKKTLTLEIGAEPPTAEDRAAISLRSSSGLQNGVLVVDGEGHVSLNIRCFVAGEWSYEVKAEDPTGWDIDNQSGTFTPQGDVDAENGARFVSTHGVKEQSGAQETNLVVTLTKQDAEPPIETEFLLPIAPA